MAPRATKKTAEKKDDAAPKAKVTKKSNSGPKAAVTAYTLFITENRETILEEAKTKNFFKAAGAAWKKCEDKSPWEERAKEDKARYQREMEEHNGQ
uniref:HMG box domain-containing protein n=1 Tax=Panagrolaimus superbus TaxID=310955 RepID=A0A914YXE9_9BILA